MRKQWTEDETQYIRDNYRVLGDVAMAKHLRRTRRSVFSKRRRLGLIRTKSETFNIKSRNARGEKSYKSHYPRKAGQIYFQTKSAQYFIKLPNGRGKPLHYHLYHERYGKAKKEHEIILRDGRYDNLDSYKIDNITLQDKTSILYRYAMSNII